MLFAMDQPEVLAVLFAMPMDQPVRTADSTHVKTLMTLTEIEMYGIPILGPVQRVTLRQ